MGNCSLSSLKVVLKGAARKEMLLTLRSLVDAAIVREEEAGKKAEKRRTKIEVE